MSGKKSLTPRIKRYKRVPLDKHLVECVLEVDEFFGNSEKTAIWFNTKTLMLGGISPAHMLECGRGEKLWMYIRNLKDGNIP